MTLSETLKTWGVERFARKTWEGKAVIRRSHGSFVIEADGLCLPFAFRADDLTATDWQVVQRRTS